MIDINKYVPKKRYPMNDLGSTFTHYDKSLGVNVPTENKLNNGGNNNGENSK